MPSETVAASMHALTLQHLVIKFRKAIVTCRSNQIETCAIFPDVRRALKSAEEEARKKIAFE